MSTQLFGIKNCDTVKKARKWLDAQRINHEFVDFREHPLSSDQLKSWVDRLGMDTVLNKRSTTYRQLDEADKQNTDPAHWIVLMQQQPTLIKRPVLVHDNTVEVGFKAARYEELFNA